MLTKNLIFLFTIWIFFILLLSSCEKNEKAVILLSPRELYLTANSLDVVVIDVTCNSPLDMKRLLIKSREEGSYSKIELDSSISGKDFYMQYEYLVPEVADTSKIFIEFNLLDASNKNVTNFKVISVFPTSFYLTETAGNTMYSGNSGKQNGYDLISGEPQFGHLAPTYKLHIIDTTNTETLLKRWVSPLRLKFVKHNGFDYANCTNIGAKAAFDSGVKFEFLDNIAEGDIYITKIKNQESIYVFLVVKIISIIDEPGSDMDRYVFNIKR